MVRPFPKRGSWYLQLPLGDNIATVPALSLRLQVNRKTLEGHIDVQIPTYLDEYNVALSGYECQ
jgi:hypothetical protein